MESNLWQQFVIQCIRNWFEIEMEEAGCVGIQNAGLQVLLIMAQSEHLSSTTLSWYRIPRVRSQGQLSFVAKCVSELHPATSVMGGYPGSSLASGRTMVGSRRRLEKGWSHGAECTEYFSIVLGKESDLPLSVCCCVLQMYWKSVLELWAINTFPEDTWRETKLACDLPQFCLNRSWLCLWFKMALLTQNHSQVVAFWLCGQGSLCQCRLLTPLIWVICWDAVNLPIAMDQTLVQIQTGSFHMEECGLASLYGHALRKKKK